MIKDISSLKIGQVWNAARGSTSSDTIECQPNFGADIHLVSPVTSDIMLVRLKDGVMAVLSDLHTTVQLTCSRCLENYAQEVQIKSFERQFDEHLPRSVDFDPLEVFQIRHKDMSIDLTESFRQEIILHFPMIPVCSERCLGLCSSCSVNLNGHPHQKGCTEVEKTAFEATSLEGVKPFANLKDLFNQ